MVFVVAPRRKKGPPMSVYMQEDDFRAIGLSMNVREVALGDAWLAFASYDGSARDFFTGMKTEKAHWFNAAADTSFNNPIYTSLSAQGQHAREFGAEATAHLLASAGLKLGQIRPPAKEDGDTVKGANNPYSDTFKGTPAEREARIASLLKTGGTRLAASLAKAAGKTITGQKLQPVGAARMQR